MSTVTIVIGWICKLPRLTEEVQLQRVKAAGAEDFVIDGRRDRDRPRETWKTLLARVRPGDTVVICHGRALIDPKGDGTPRAKFFSRLGEIEDRGAAVWDLHTDLRSDDRKQRDQLAVATLDAAAKAARGANGGRQMWIPSPEQRAWAYPMWIEPRTPTNGEAVRLIRAEAKRRKDSRMMRVTASVLSKEHRFGPSGRAAWKVNRAKPKTRR